MQELERWNALVAFMQLSLGDLLKVCWLSMILFFPTN